MMSKDKKNNRKKKKQPKGKSGGTFEIVEPTEQHEEELAEQPEEELAEQHEEELAEQPEEQRSEIKKAPSKKKKNKKAQGESPVLVQVIPEGDVEKVLRLARSSSGPDKILEEAKKNREHKGLAIACIEKNNAVPCKCLGDNKFEFDLGEGVKLTQTQIGDSLSGQFDFKLGPDDLAKRLSKTFVISVPRIDDKGKELVGKDNKPVYDRILVFKGEPVAFYRQCQEGQSRVTEYTKKYKLPSKGPLQVPEKSPPSVHSPKSALPPSGLPSLPSTLPFSW